MKKDKGFTLIEILAVVTIIGLIFILVIPKITSSLKNKKGDVDSTTNNIVISATKLYVQEHSSKFDKEESNTYCMPINMLVKKGYLESPVKNVTDDEDITDTKSVKITYDNGFKYEIVGKKDCYAVKNNIFVDNDGGKYKQVEYLESTGTQYIDTGVYSTSQITLEITIKGDYAKVAWYGGRNGNFIGIYNYNGRFDYVGLDSEYINPSANEWHTISHGRKLIIDGVLIKSYSDRNYETDYSIVLFAGNNHGEIYSYSSIKIKTVIIKINETKVRDYIPVIDSSDHPCFFDKVEKKCYYNQGTGEFLYG